MTEVQPTPPRSQPEPPRPLYRRLWFWVLLAVAVAPFIRFLLIHTRHEEPNENSAIQTLRTIAAAEITYNSTYPANGYSCSLASLGGNPASGPPNAHAAQLIDPDLSAAGQKSGYTFALTCTAKVTVGTRDVYTSYEITAVPQTVGKTGDRGFCLNDTGDLKVDPTGGANCTNPPQ